MRLLPVEGLLSSVLNANGSRCKKCSTDFGASCLTVDRCDGGSLASSLRAAKLEKKACDFARYSGLD